MGDIAKILKVQQPTSYTFSVSERQSPDAYEDYTIKKVMNTVEGTIEKIPVNSNDIVNKAYADSIAGGLPTNPVVLGSLTVNGSMIAGSYFGYGGNLTGISSTGGLPQGVLPVGSIPNLPAYIPQGLLPVGSIPSLSYLPQGQLPIGSIPTLSYLPQGVLPTGSVNYSSVLPQGLLPVGSIPSLSYSLLTHNHTGSYLPQGQLPVGSIILTSVLPQGVLPTGSVNYSGVIPQGQLVVGSLPTNYVQVGSVTGSYVAAPHPTSGAGSFSPYVINVIYGTGNPPAANTVPEGTLFIQYIA